MAVETAGSPSSFPAASPSVASALGALPDGEPVSSWDVVRSLFEIHPEYGDGRAGELTGATGPPHAERRARDAWLVAVAEEFPGAEIHGRLLVRGLVRLDAALASFLRRERVLQAIAAEQFVWLLNNREKSRRTGFVAAVRGATDLAPFEEACQHQTWNRCFTARYRVEGPVLVGLIEALLADLAASRNGEPAGTLRPDAHQWSRLRDTVLGTLADTRSGFDAAELVAEFFLAAATSLDVGERLVLFAEAPRPDEVRDLASLGLDDERLAQEFGELPQRLAFVIGGVAPDLDLRSTGVSVLDLEPGAEPRAASLGQRFLNDEPRGRDRLRIENEVHALAETLALRDVEPPLVVGVLGGWGRGKSFVLHLLEERLHDIRAEDLGPGGGEDDRSTMPYVGHPYVIRFDAWTYAKSSLWASLMRTILLELNRQVGLERTLADLGFDSRRGGSAFRLLNPMSDRRREAFRSELGAKILRAADESHDGRPANAERLWKHLKERRRKQRDDLRRREAALERLRARLLEARARIEQDVDRALERQASRLAWEPLLQTFLAPLRAKVEATAEGEQLSFEDLKPTTLLPIRLRRGFSGVTFAFLAFAVAAAFAAPFQVLLDRAWAGLEPMAAAAFGVLGAGVQLWMRSQAWLDERRREYQEAMKAARSRLENQRERTYASLVNDQRMRALDEEEAGANVPERDDGENVPLLEAQVSDAEAQVAAMRASAGFAATASSLLDFLEQRIASGFYDERLGLLHQVQEDIQELTEALLPSSDEQETPEADPLFPRGEPRIFLVVDDLDRCPPDRVVEVLEAAQLLMKTRLFVLVLAMDVRFITRALEKRYEGVLVRDGAPSGLDYLEKIVQIPYRVRPIQPGAMSGYLRQQMEVKAASGRPDGVVETEGAPGGAGARAGEAEGGGAAAGAPGGEGARGKPSDETAGAEPSARGWRPLPRTIRKFSTREVEVLAECCNAAVLSPRSAKRMANVFKLLKIVWERRGLDDGPPMDVKQAMLTMLALSAAHPEVMATLLRRLEDRFRVDPRSSDRLADFVKAQCSQGMEGPRAREWERVCSIALDDGCIPKELTLEQLDERNLLLVSAFSFLGDSDPDLAQGVLRPPSQGHPGADEAGAPA